MKSIQFETTGPPAEVLKIHEIAVPEPGPGEVRIRVRAANINPSDLMFVQGLYGIRPRFPSPAGFEGAGVIDALGEGTSLPVGMRVIFTAIGTWQEYVVVPAASVIPTPEDMDDLLACQAFVNPCTAVGMLHLSDLKSGDYLLFTAAASALGKMVLQLCVSRGIRFIGTVRQPEQVSLLLEMGATAVIQTETQDMVKEVMLLTGKKGVDYCFEAVGGKVGEQALSCLGYGKTMMVYGLLSLQPTPVNSGLMLFKDLTIRGFWLNSWLNSLDPEAREYIQSHVLEMLIGEEMRTYIEGQYSLDQVKEAVIHAEKPGRNGKAIFVLE